MFLASLLIGLREGLEAALIVSILLAYLHKLGRNDVRRRMWAGVGLAVVLIVIIGAVSTFGRSRLSFEAQEVLGGSMSVLAAGMVTWMVFWMMSAGRRMQSELEGSVDRALLIGGGFAVFWIAFLAVAREGVETTLMLWGWVGNLVALGGALLGIALAAGIGYGLYRGAIRINLGTFFTWSSVFLLIIAAGILAYGIHDLQEAAVLPGPFSGAPISPTHPRTGEVLTGFADYPFWGAAYPFGWAFNLENVIEPTGFLAALLKGTVGFAPMMTWLEVTVWAIYLITVIPAFIRRARRLRRPAARSAATTPDASAGAPTATPALTPVAAAADGDRAAVGRHLPSPLSAKGTP
ncbi:MULTISPECIES: iron uptake transporter permease EfeU [Citricoccus]|uniref:iron uptake transporter permease EfeU n=1 Tax=Citricoccus TaxID=169133 RepID=UPI000255EE70|nr:iron uptake transporter permease EfeU [Citricoccus sp. CH26A]